MSGRSARRKRLQRSKRINSTTAVSSTTTDAAAAAVEAAADQEPQPAPIGYEQQLTNKEEDGNYNNSPDETLHEDIGCSNYYEVSR